MTEETTDEEKTSDEKTHLVQVQVGASAPSSLRLVASLAIAGLLSGLILVGAYVATKDQIEANDAARVMRAVETVLRTDAQIPVDATRTAPVRYEPRILVDGELRPFEGAQTTAECSAAAPEGRCRRASEGCLEGECVNLIFVGIDADGSEVGYAIPARGPGFMDTIELIYGFDVQLRRIVGLAVTKQVETPGLGDRISKDQNFLANFDDLDPSTEMVGVKQDTEADNEIECITGATISSNYVIDILNGSVRELRPVLFPVEPAADAQGSAPEEGR